MTQTPVSSKVQNFDNIFYVGGSFQQCQQDDADFIRVVSKCQKDLYMSIKKIYLEAFYTSVSFYYLRRFVIL